MVDLQHAFLRVRYVMQVDGYFAQCQNAVVRNERRTSKCVLKIKIIIIYYYY